MAAQGGSKIDKILAAPRKLTSTSGISRLAYSLALYTEAPASLTTILSILEPPWAAMALISASAKASVSRLAVPLPIAIKLTPWRWHKRPKVCSDPSQSQRGSWG